MHSVRIELAKLIVVGTRLTYCTKPPGATISYLYGSCISIKKAATISVVSYSSLRVWVVAAFLHETNHNRLRRRGAPLRVVNKNQKHWSCSPSTELFPTYTNDNAEDEINTTRPKIEDVKAPPRTLAGWHNRRRRGVIVIHSRVCLPAP